MFSNSGGQNQKVRFLLDTVETVTVPEPSTLALFGLGFAGLMMRRLRTK